jgi:hypothetical protein
MKAAILLHHGSETHLQINSLDTILLNGISIKILCAYGTESLERKWPKLVTSADEHGVFFKSDGSAHKLLCSLTLLLASARSALLWDHKILV